MSFISFLEYVTGQLGGFISFMESINESRTEIAVTSLLFCSVICFIWLLLVGRFAKVVVYTMIFAM
ncbi:hypothetical protein T492DRAFT_863810 [Pavlovales sp. CCMP2436]|nr:hypothetical protein T492DRAFT_863810 [Pavlovales sp. CCMP2436]